MKTFKEFLTEGNVVIFKPVSDDISRQLINFYENNRVKLGSVITINDEDYVLDYISKSSSKFFKSRGLSIYFRTGRSIIRISDHWSKSVGNDRSRKLNCGGISDNDWIFNTKVKRYSIQKGAKYPFTVLIGKAGLNKLNKKVDHWK